MTNNIVKKVIIYTNTAKRAEVLKDKQHNYWNSNEHMKGDTILIHRNMYSDENFLSNVKFTTKPEDPKARIDGNKFIQGFLLQRQAALEIVSTPAMCTE